MSSMLVIAVAVVLIAMAAWWFARFTGNSDFNERYAKYQEKSDELSRTMSLTYVCCRRDGCKHMNGKGKCLRRSISLDTDGRCKDYDGG